MKNRPTKKAYREKVANVSMAAAVVITLMIASHFLGGLGIVLTTTFASPLLAVVIYHTIGQVILNGIFRKNPKMAER